MDVNESPQGVGTGKEGLESIMEIQPKDPSKGHFYVSLAKSFLRITGFVALFLAGANPELMTSWLKVTAGFLMLAECLGILEELV